MLLYWWVIMEELSNILCLATMKDLAFYLAITISWETFKRQITPFLDLLLHLYWYNPFRRKMSNASFIVVNESYWNAFKEFSLGSLKLKRVCMIICMWAGGAPSIQAQEGFPTPPLYIFFIFKRLWVFLRMFWSAIWWSRFFF